MIEAAFGFAIDPSDWRLDPTQAGGSLYDVGCYGLNAARLFTGTEPIRVDGDARWSSETIGQGVDMTARVGLTFPGGVLASVTCSFESPLRAELTLVGTKGTLHLPDAFLPPEQSHWLACRDDAEPQRRDFATADQYAEQMACFVRSVRAGRLEAPAENGLANMRALEHALQTVRRSVAARHV